ncbi:unnamed protein product [Cyclocybe aegerita]|uniref:Uncharacterized protein n=1 Tax=Cyclocybe aegerita TaxID=1973307 RepID=A0A8S0X7D1_CYCAE|nr:unnamed protein product [Cyclocybe aegerita]
MPVPLSCFYLCPCPLFSLPRPLFSSTCCCPPIALLVPTFKLHPRPSPPLALCPRPSPPPFTAALRLLPSTHLPSTHLPSTHQQQLKHKGEHEEGNEPRTTSEERAQRARNEPNERGTSPTSEERAQRVRNGPNEQRRGGGSGGGSHERRMESTEGAEGYSGRRTSTGGAEGTCRAEEGAGGPPVPLSRNSAS